MNYFIDDVARILAGPTPRRKALKLIGGVFAGSLFGSFALGQSGPPVQDPNCFGLAAGTKCPDKSSGQCCGEYCLGRGIGTPGSALCCPNTFVCPPTRCCLANGTAGCCPPGTCGKLVTGASDVCTSVGGAVPTGCTTDSSLCG
jgi:hypothetical protein